MIAEERMTAPDWLAEEMPPGYQTRVQEIERLRRELQDIERFGYLLWATGRPLEESVHTVLTSLKLEVTPVEPDNTSSLSVRTEDRRRLLVHIASAKGAIPKKHESLAQVFRLLHEIAEPSDRVVLVANTFPDQAPPDRPAPLEADALALLTQLHANFVSSSTLFSLWISGLQDTSRARTYLEKLHAQEGGIFQLPVTAGR